jgi:hypothetical protein
VDKTLQKWSTRSASISISVEVTVEDFRSIWVHLGTEY